MPGAAPQRLRILRLCKILLTACAAAVLLFLPFAGRFFSAADPLQRGDAIVVLAGSRVDRWLEAVDLFKEGWAPRVVLSPGPVSTLEVKLRGEGLRLPREGDLARDAVLSLGVPADAVTVMPGGVDNTAAEAAALRRWLPPGSHRGHRRHVSIPSAPRRVRLQTRVRGHRHRDRDARKPLYRGAAGALVVAARRHQVPDERDAEVPGVRDGVE